MPSIYIATAIAFIVVLLMVAVRGHQIRKGTYHFDKEKHPYSLLNSFQNICYMAVRYMRQMAASTYTWRRFPGGRIIANLVGLVQGRREVPEAAREPSSYLENISRAKAKEERQRENKEYH